MSYLVLANENITPLSKEKSIYHLKLQSTDALEYEPGDWLSVTVQNQPEMVVQFLDKMGLNGNEIIDLRRVGEVPLKEALSRHLELTQLNPAILNKLQRQRNLNLWADRQAMMAYANGKDILDCIDAFDFIKPMGLDFVAMLSPLAPRYYSIASAAETATIAQNEVHLVYKKVVYENLSRQRFGVATQFLSGLKQGNQIKASLIKNEAFKLPDNPQTPVIMIGSGTGIAPFIGFCQARFSLSEATQNWLFFGETHAKTNFLFEDRLLQWQSEHGLILTTAFSRDGESSQKNYVQHQLWQAKSQVWEWLTAGAHLYICGDKNLMAKAVEQVLLDIVKSEGHVAEPEAFLKSLKQQKRLQLDVY